MRKTAIFTLLFLLTIASCGWFGKKKKGNQQQVQSKYSFIDHFANDPDPQEDPKLAKINLTEEELKKGKSYNVFIHGYNGKKEVWNPIRTQLRKSAPFDNEENHVFDEGITIDKNGNIPIQEQADIVLSKMPSLEELKQYDLINIWDHSMGTVVGPFVAMKLYEVVELRDKIRFLHFTPALKGVPVVNNARTIVAILNLLQQILRDTKSFAIKKGLEAILGINIEEAINLLEGFIQHYAKEYLKPEKTHKGVLEIAYDSTTIKEMRSFIVSSGIKGWIAICSGMDDALGDMFGTDPKFHAAAAILITEVLDMKDLPKSPMALLKLMRNKVSQQDNALIRTIASLNGRKDLVKHEHDGLIPGYSQSGGNELTNMTRKYFPDLYHSKARDVDISWSVLGNKDVHEESIKFVRYEFIQQLKRIKASN